jgi:molybdate transport system substrate-binding protein
MATRHVLRDLALDYERASLGVAHIECAGGVDVARRVMDGEAFDFVVLDAPALDKLTTANRIDAQSRVGLARSSVAVAVRAGGAIPDTSSEQSVNAAVIAARRIGISTGPSGRHVRGLLERWRIDARDKVVEAPPGVPVADLLARGDVDLGFQQLSELRGMPGIDIAGLLPPAIQEVTLFAGAVCAAARDREGAARFLSFCASASTAAVKRRHGMEPA